MQKLLGQLMNCCIDVDSSEEEDYEHVSRSRVRCSMTSLINWYESATKVRFFLYRWFTETSDLYIL